MCSSLFLHKREHLTKEVQFQVLNVRIDGLNKRDDELFIKDFHKD